ncbi:charged multivesicular body protein 6 [Trypanosoma conorhini]|uniref:Charged multivesicular body protein 6 n=1 Tax=Trypanosoma conorhini TaxID=83891 RepID=A0A422PM93_9TRYP|nr:charged multivesicular body protein 6 [Trypanosoma conorhini]RNF18808.1 charged multivesicular body protein 6 [Trypanosoma conorhini]
MGAHTSKVPVQQRKVSAEAPKAVITSSDRAQLELKLQRDRLMAAVRRYDVVAKEERAKAREFVRSGNRRKALYCLKREQLQRTQVTSVTDMLDNVQRLLDTVEFTQIELEVFDAIKGGKEELSKLNAMLNVDDIAELMDDTAETIEEARRINVILAQPLEGYEDDEALLAELLSQGVSSAPAAEVAVEEVAVPTHKLPQSPATEGHATAGESERIGLSA